MAAVTIVRSQMNGSCNRARSAGVSVRRASVQPDAKLRVVMRGEIKSLHQRLKTTTIYVTHDQAMMMADAESGDRLN